MPPYQILLLRNVGNADIRNILVLTKNVLLKIKFEILQSIFVCNVILVNSLFYFVG